MNPERTLPDSPCRVCGWWYNSATGLCYSTQQSCILADPIKGICSQPKC